MDVTNPPAPASCLPPASGAPASVSRTSAPTTPSPRACIPSTTNHEVCVNTHEPSLLPHMQEHEAMELKREDERTLLRKK